MADWAMTPLWKRLLAPLTMTSRRGSLVSRRRSVSSQAAKAVSAAATLEYVGAYLLGASSGRASFLNTDDWRD